MIRKRPMSSVNLTRRFRHQDKPMVIDDDYNDQCNNVIIDQLLSAPS